MYIIEKVLGIFFERICFITKIDFYRRLENYSLKKNRRVEIFSLYFIIYLFFKYGIFIIIVRINVYRGCF